MPSLYAWWTRASDVPAWAPLFDLDTYRRFESQLLDVLVAFGAAPSRSQVRTGIVHTPMGTVDVESLAQSWHLLPPNERSTFLRRHLERSVPHSDHELKNRLFADWTLARPLVRVQWVDVERVPDYHGEGELPDGVQEVADGLVAVLTLELPETVPFFRPSHTSWDVSTETLFETAYANVDRLLSTAELTEVVNDGGLDLYQILHKSLSTSCVLRNLHRRMHPEHGLLVLLPVLQVVMVHPVDPSKTRSMLEQLPAIGDYVRRVHPGANTKRVWWLYEGTLTLLATVDEAGSPVAPDHPGARLQIPARLEARLES